MSFCFGKQPTTAFCASTRGQTVSVNEELQSSSPLAMEKTVPTAAFPPVPVLVASLPQPQDELPFRPHLPPIGSHLTQSNARHEDPLAVMSSGLPCGANTHGVDNGPTSTPQNRVFPTQLLPPSILMARLHQEQFSAPVNSIATPHALFKDPSLPTACVLEVSSALSSSKVASQSTCLATSSTIESSIQQANSHSIPLTNSHPAPLPATPACAIPSSSSSSTSSLSMPLHVDRQTGPQIAPLAAGLQAPASHSPIDVAATLIPGLALSAPLAPAPDFARPSELSAPYQAPTTDQSTPSIHLIPAVTHSGLALYAPPPAVSPAPPSPFQFAAPIAPAPRPPTQIQGPFAELQTQLSDGELRFLIKGRYYKSSRDPIGRGGFSKVHCPLVNLFIFIFIYLVT